MFVVASDDTHTAREPLLPYHLFCQTAHLGKIEEDGTQMGIASENLDGIRSRATSEVKEDIDGCKRIGAHELHFDPTFLPGAQKLDRWLGLMEEWRKLV